MSLRHAILVSLTKSEATGYDLAKNFDRTLGFCWKATHQQIYKELGKLDAEGLVTYEHIQQIGKPSKKLYKITGSGKSELARWISQPSKVSPIKDSFLIKVFGGHAVNPELLLKELKQHRKQHEMILMEYRSLHKLYEAGKDNLNKDEQYAWFALKRGIAMEETWLRWAEDLEQYIDTDLREQQSFTDKFTIPTTEPAAASEKVGVPA